jgi:hypothetical protein
VGAYSLNKFVGPGPNCAQAALDYCHALADGFSAGMKIRGRKAAFSKRDQDVSPKQWQAKTQMDPGGIGTAEFVYLASHGYFFGTQLKNKSGAGEAPWLFWFLANCDSPDGCKISTIEVDDKHWTPPNAQSPKTMLALGEGRLRWLVIDCCRSLQLYDVNEREAPYKNLSKITPGQTWGRCYKGVRMLFGFTGLSSDADWTKERGLSFGLRAGRGEALAESWIDEAFSWIIKGVDAPVVTAFGDSVAEADRRLKSDTIKNNGASPTSPASGLFAITIWRS